MSSRIKKEIPKILRRVENIKLPRSSFACEFHGCAIDLVGGYSYELISIFSVPVLRYYNQRFRAVRGDEKIVTMMFVGHRLLPNVANCLRYYDDVIHSPTDTPPTSDASSSDSPKTNLERLLSGNIEMNDTTSSIDLPTTYTVGGVDLSIYNDYGSSTALRNSSKTLKCPKCNWHYKYQETLEIHMKEKHADGDVKCGYCVENRVHPKLARGESYSCGYKPYRCELCKYSTTTKGNLSIHMQSDKHLHAVQELPSSIASFNILSETHIEGAQFCDRSKLGKVRIRKFMPLIDALLIRLHYDIVELISASLSCPPARSPPSDDDRTLVCVVCGCFSSDDLEEMIAHADKMHKDQNPFSLYNTPTVSVLSFQDRSSPSHGDISMSSGVFRCHLCPYHTNLKANFQLHTRTDKHLQRVQMASPRRVTWESEFVTVMDGVDVGDDVGGVTSLRRLAKTHPKHSNVTFVTENLPEANYEQKKMDETTFPPLTSPLKFFAIKKKLSEAEDNGRSDAGGMKGGVFSDGVEHVRDSFLSDDESIDRLSIYLTRIAALNNKNNWTNPKSINYQESPLKQTLRFGTVEDTLFWSRNLRRAVKDHLNKRPSFRPIDANGFETLLQYEANY
ncbi:zinc finger, C2H2 type [Dictyocaulus viviparus]|uniref:Zinc finger, C2H2 type n=1 Tax=Dictyocaulus viviparus TaxID=29172 RepID=A0A0D8XP49_DICVI|nr:zinc finger, C2H2 type [Dictyocaulus viviparus]